MNLTSHQELQEEIEKINPDCIGIEITQEDINNNFIENYPDEMQFILHYAKDNSINFFGFDSNINIFRENINVTEIEEELIREQKKIISKYSWKDFNKSENAKLLKTSTEKRLINPNKFKLKQQEMAQNIKNNISSLTKNSKVLIITGCSHLDFFEKEFEGVQFPLRN